MSDTFEAWWNTQQVWNTEVANEGVARDAYRAGAADRERELRQGGTVPEKLMGQWSAECSGNTSVDLPGHLRPPTMSFGEWCHRRGAAAREAELRQPSPCGVDGHRMLDWVANPYVGGTTSGTCSACRREQAREQVLRQLVRAAQEGRCVICGWPLASDASQGCVIGDCAYRPDGEFEKNRIRERRALLKEVPRG